MDSQTIRFYERHGLLPEPHRAPNGYPMNDTAAIDRLRFIRASRRAGPTLAETAQVLDPRDAGQEPCAHVTLVLDHKLAGVRARQQGLADQANELGELIETSHTLDPADCGPERICHIIATA